MEEEKEERGKRQERKKWSRMPYAVWGEHYFAFEGFRHQYGVVLQDDANMTSSARIIRTVTPRETHTHA